MIKINDRLLIMQIKNGNTAAFEILVNKYYDQIYQFCYRRFFGNKELAEDLTQDIFLKLVANIADYKFTGKFFNYLFTITVNTCNNYSKKKKLDTIEFFDEHLEGTITTTFEELLITKENKNFLQKSLDQLSGIQKEAIILRYYYNFKVKEIAKITGTSSSTTQSRINQGLKKLNYILREKEEHHE